MIHLYAVAAGLRGLPPAPGLDDAPVEHRPIAGLDLVVSVHETSIAPSEEAVVRHAQVVDAMVGQSNAVLPARFGRDFRDDAALSTAVEEHRLQLRETLERVAGCVELGVRVVAPRRGEQQERSLGGRDYMTARLAQVVEMDSVVNALHEPLARRARDSVRVAAATSQPVLSAAYLVPLEDVDAFRVELAELERMHPELTVVCTGPWPPYSFAGTSEVNV